MVSIIKTKIYNSKTSNNSETNRQSFGRKSKEKLITYKNMATATITTVGAWGITDYIVDEFLDSAAIVTKDEQVVRKRLKIPRSAKQKLNRLV